MFGWRKKYNVLFWSIIIPCVIGLCTLAAFEIIGQVLAAVLSGAVCLLLYAELLMSAAAADRKMYKLKQDCKIEQYVLEIKKIYDGTNHYRYKRVAAIDLASGYILQGRFEEAAIVLNQYGPLQILKFQDIHANAVYYANLAEIYFKLGEIAAAEEVAAKLLKLSDEERAADCMSTLHSVNYDVNVYRMMACGKYDLAATLLENALLGDVVMCEKVATRYDLAVCYENLGELQKAKELYEFVAANGGDTYYAAEAKKKLSEMPQ